MWQSIDSVADEIEPQRNQLPTLLVKEIEHYVDSAGDWHRTDDDEPCLHSLVGGPDAIMCLKESVVWPISVFLALESNEDRVGKMCSTQKPEIRPSISMCLECGYSRTDELEEGIGTPTNGSGSIYGAYVWTVFVVESQASVASLINTLARLVGSRGSAGILYLGDVPL